MHDILKEIVSKRMMRIEAIKAGYSSEERREIARQAKVRKRRIRQSFKHALEHSKAQRAVIAEFKRASPSKGDIRVEADPREQALIYEKNGASAISVLTEPEYFKGSLQDLKKVARATTLPILCKDFIVDKIQIDFAKLSGADAVLLIAAILDQETLFEFYKYARSLNLDVLVESHNQIEVMKALKLPEALIGINNRNLRTFNTDIGVTSRLTALIPQGRFVVSESGMKTVEDLDQLKKQGAHAFLVGETLMTQEGEGFMKAFTGYEKTVQVKICGLKRLSDVRVANELKVDYVGFVFTKSKRQVGVEQAKKLIEALNPSIKAVGVFVNRSKDDVERIAELCGLDVIQLHGDESLEAYPAARVIWKSKAVKDVEKIENELPEQASGIVFDTFSKKMAGGTGKTYEWKSALPAGQFHRIAAGGLNAENVSACINILKPDVLDISSGVESDGYKDPEKMRTFMTVVEKVRV